jgi:peptide/nickel transport system permease protein
MTLMPGDPVELMIQANPRITSEDIARLRAIYGLDQPLYERYGKWMSTILSGDLGFSRTYRIPVTEMLGPRLVNTFILSLTALFVSLLIAIPLGVIAALKRGSKFDYAIGLFAFTGISTPSFWLGIMMILVFGVWFKLFPASGTYTVGADFASMSFFEIANDRIQYLVLPVLTLAYISIGGFLRFTRSAMLDAMGNDYIRTAKAKGLPWRRVVLAHGFRNALLPLITTITLSFSFVFSGATITETVFAYQGMGRLILESIMGNDYNVAMICVMITVVMVLLFNLIADLLYSFADPRITLK